LFTHQSNDSELGLAHVDDKTESDSNQHNFRHPYGVAIRFSRTGAS
jgi:hypothetical protein